MAWFLKFYQCDHCGEKWHDEWSCLCNDRCPNCDLETEVSDGKDLSVLVQSPDRDADKFVVLRSSDAAEHEPDYEVVKVFETKSEAEACAEALRDEGREFAN
jgi:hypothetical protein